jgi:hypothetical protein
MGRKSHVKFKIFQRYNVQIVQKTCSSLPISDQHGELSLGSVSNLMKSTYFHILFRLSVFNIRNTEWRLNYCHDIFNSWDFSKTYFCALPSEWQQLPRSIVNDSFRFVWVLLDYANINKLAVIIVGQNRLLWLISLVRFFQWSSTCILRVPSHDRHTDSIFYKNTYLLNYQNLITSSSP